HVTPKAGFVWDDNTKSEKVIRVVITNFTTHQKMGKVSDEMEKVRTAAIVMASLGAAAAAIAAAYWGLVVWSFGTSSAPAIAATAQSVALFAQSAAFGTLYELNNKNEEYNEIKGLDVIYTSDNLQFGFLVTKSVVYLTQVVRWINYLYKPFVAMKSGIYLLEFGITCTSWAVPAALAILTTLTVILSFIDVILTIPGVVI
ncbi:MAG: hypothetical protein HUJ42_03830, partial [Malacoplasma sp.]|nr:hypothetical protein [Malacoplasma sp.]